MKFLLVDQLTAESIVSRGKYATTLPRRSVVLRFSCTYPWNIPRPSQYIALSYVQLFFFFGRVMISLLGNKHRNIDANI